MASLKNLDFGSKSGRVSNLYRGHISDMSMVKISRTIQSLGQKTIFQGSLRAEMGCTEIRFHGMLFSSSAALK